jgi:hypothetical protein
LELRGGTAKFLSPRNVASSRGSAAGKHPMHCFAGRGGCDGAGLVKSTTAIAPANGGAGKLVICS